MSKEGRTKVFVSYSHTDSEWLKRLQIHLKPLERDGLVELWDDTKIQPGAQWRDEIKKALDSAQIAILLVSADFLASDFIAENELPPLLAAAEKYGLIILSLILRPCLFEETDGLAKFRSVNPPSKPLIGLTPAEQEDYLVTLSKAVLGIMKESARKSTKKGLVERQQIFSLPFPRNKFFTGRDDILKSLRKSFIEGDAVQSLNGLGGIGKTQTAAEYAYRYRDSYKVVLWGKAHTSKLLVSDFVAMATLLNLPEKDSSDQSEAVDAVKRWLAKNDEWLLILDNADDDLEMTRGFIPSNDRGHVLLTTRAQYVGDIAARNSLHKMRPEDGALFLLRKTEKLKKNEPLESAPLELREQAEALSKELDGLPLALDQSAAFIGEMQSSIEAYLSLYKRERTALLAHRGKFTQDHQSVAVTFSLAFKKVEDASPEAADVLRVCAFLDADSIPEEIFTEAGSELGELLGSIAESPFELTKAIGEAGRFSLLQPNPDSKTVSLHRLVQEVLRAEMNDGVKKMWAERAVRATNETFPDVEYSNWPLCDRLISHAQSLTAFIDEYGFEFPAAARMINQTAYYFTERAQYAEAEPLYERALAIREKSLGPEHPDTAKSLNNLAFLYRAQARYVEAKRLYERALAIREKSLGPEHLDTAGSLSQLAKIYRVQKKYTEAELLFKRALAIREKSLGPEHPDTANSLNNLASLYRAQARYIEAKPLYERALAIREKSLSPEHPHTATSLNNLALLYALQGGYAEAEPLYKRALAIREKSLGREHPYTATTLNDLAGLYNLQGRYVDAEHLYQRALDISSKVFGTEHPDTFRVLEGYAALLRKMNRQDEADELESRGRALR